MDISIASVGVVTLAPLLIGTAIAVRAESRGPVIFRQTRVGENGRPFTIFKFRSMFVGAENLHAKLQGEVKSAHDLRFKDTRDPRITRVGRFIRRTSIDELPQLFNVLRGDMSIVGPRPALPSEVAQYAIADRDRLLVKPGITCIWQVSGRADIDFVGQVKLDRQYIRTRSLFGDISLLLRTIPAVLSGRGSY
jgi:lipopolysaccharide/colanic/teichoic acid biosynthesis glycosyltransferase